MKREFCIKTGKSNKTPQKRALQKRRPLCSKDAVGRGGALLRPAECAVLYGNLRQIRNFPNGPTESSAPTSRFRHPALCRGGRLCPPSRMHRFFWESAANSQLLKRADSGHRPLQIPKLPLHTKGSFACLQFLINRSGAADVFRARAGAEDVGLADLFD